MRGTTPATAIRSPAQKPVEEAPSALSWTEFSDRYFPARRRHDFPALRAWQKYTAPR